MEEQCHSHYVFIGAKQLSPVPEKYRSLLVPGQDCRVDGQVALNQGWPGSNTSANLFMNF